MTAVLQRVGGVTLSMGSEMTRVLMVFGLAHMITAPYLADGETAPRKYCLVRFCEARR